LVGWVREKVSHLGVGFVIVVFLQETLQEAFGMKGEGVGWAGGGNGYVAVKECQDRRGAQKTLQDLQAASVRRCKDVFRGALQKKKFCAPD
jgi:hypothetical protein